MNSDREKMVQLRQCDSSTLDLFSIHHTLTIVLGEVTSMNKMQSLTSRDLESGNKLQKISQVSVVKLGTMCHGN